MARSVKHLPSHGKEPIVVARVVKCRNDYVCGICRVGYKEKNEAIGCLKRCFDEYMDQSQVIQSKRGAKCRYCGREYGEMDGASSCAADCRQKIVDTFEMEFQVMREIAEAAEVPPMDGKSSRQWNAVKRQLVSIVAKKPSKVDTDTPAKAVGAKTEPPKSEEAEKKTAGAVTEKQKKK